jgi:putative endonuclease
MPYMYILQCVDGTFYTGSTWDLNRRLEQHNSGEGANYTSKRLPVTLVYHEYYESIKVAYEREKQVQGWSSKKKQALIDGNEEELHIRAECQNETHFRNKPE